MQGGFFNLTPPKKLRVLNPCVIIPKHFSYFFLDLPPPQEFSKCYTVTP